MIHKPVLLKETIDKLNLSPGMTVVDGTLGGGGHSLAVLKKILPGGTLVSIDRDRKAIQIFEKRLEEGISVAKRKLVTSARLVPVNINIKNDDQAFSRMRKLGNREGKIVGSWCGAADNYANIKEIIRGLGIKSVEGILLDLGFSSDQIEDAERGFSFTRSGKLDMRYSMETQKKTAADIVNDYTEEQLDKVFKQYGEERFSKKIAREIAKSRKIKRINLTDELVEIILKAVPERYQRGKIHPATKVFQALRIETNRELENLKRFLDQAVEVLASKGILAIISFHSLEDRMVKKFFREEAKDCICPPKFPKCVCGHRAKLRIVTKKPITASAGEIVNNPRARSAKLRVAEKINQSREKKK